MGLSSRAAKGGKAYLNRHVGRVGSCLRLYIGYDICPVTSRDERDGSRPIVSVVGTDGTVSEGAEEASAPSWETLVRATERWGIERALYTSSACGLDGRGRIAGQEKCCGLVGAG